MEASEYIAYLLCEAGKSSCIRGGKLLQISHDEMNRFLETVISGVKASLTEPKGL